jgi:hypothetical protein
MVQYDFTRLGAAGFEKLCQALAKPVLGLQVRLTDATGRDYLDAEFDGTLDSSEVANAGKWNGPGVLMVKYVPVSGRPREDFRALESTLKLDLDRLHKLQLSGTSNDRFPRYIIYATNIPLTKNIDGGLDAINSLIAGYVDLLSLEGWAVWDADQISAYLDKLPDVRLSFVLAQDYISQLRPTSHFEGLTVFRPSSLGERPSECAEIVPAWWRLLATHEAVTGLFETLYSVRRTVGQTDETETGRSSKQVQDLLRAAIVFVSAGVDACLESLLSHAVPPLATHNDNARGKFERYLENQAHAPKAGSAFVAALKSPDPRGRLLELYILSLVSASFQGSSSIKDRGLAALGITNGQLPHSRVASLDAFFTARNDVVHRLDLIQPDAADARPASQPRNEEDVGRMCDEALLLIRDLIIATATNLNRCRLTGES